METTIRQGEEKDIDAIDAFYRLVIADLNAHTNYPGWQADVHPSRAEAAEAIRSGTLYLAEEEQLIGTMIVDHTAEAAFFDAPWRVTGARSGCFVIHSLAIDPKRKRQGLGQTFLSFAEALAKRENGLALRVSILQGNSPAVGLFRQAGFSYVGTVSLGHEDLGLPWFDLYEKPL